MSSTAGARYLAESEQWLAVQAKPARPVGLAPDPQPAPATAPLYDVAAHHDGQLDSEAWLKMFYRMYGEMD